MREAPVKLAAGLTLVVLVAVGSCRDQAAPDDPNDPTPPGIVSDPVTPIVAAAAGGSAAAVPGVAYASFRPGTFPGGMAATISNPNGIGAITVPLVAGGLDPVAIPAQVGDSLTFTIDAGGVLPLRFVKVVPPAVSATVVRTEPSGGRRDVPLNIRVRVVFSEPVDPTSVTSSTLRLLRDGVPQSGETALSADGLDATFTPAGSLLPNTDYTLEVGAGVHDEDGAPLEAPFTAAFTTGTSSGEAVALKFDLQPVKSLAGLPIHRVLVSARDAAGNLATGFAGIVTVAVTETSGGATLSGPTALAGAGWFEGLRIDPAGSGYTLVATSPGLQSATSEPFDVVAPSDELLAYTSYGEGIVVWQKDGASSLLDPATRDAFQSTWSPDGESIAFVTLEPEREGDLDGSIYVMRRDGHQVTNLHQPGFLPAWSPDGSRIAFARTGGPGQSEIYVMSPQGTNVLKLTENGGRNYAPAWSPDGARLAFVRSAGPSIAHETIYVMNSDGSGLTSLDREGSYPAWSPDGSAIAFSRLSSEPYVGDIYVMRDDGSAVRRLTSNQSPGNSMDPVWSPDGSTIAFSSSADPDIVAFQIYVMNADGSGVVKVSLTREGSGLPSSFPAWSP